MRRISLSAIVVLALVVIDLSFSVTYAKDNTTYKVKIFKVTKVSQSGNLQLRAWPSPKSRIKKSLPYNAKDLTETGKKKVVGRTKWLEVNWRNTRGWVNSHYLKKTGVLVKAKTDVATTRISRNTTPDEVATQKVATQAKKQAAIIVATSNEMPQTFGGDRYDHEMSQIAATELKMAYSGKADNSSRQRLDCSGSTPNFWNIKMNMAGKKMIVRLSKNKAFSVPINYHEWASPTKVRMNLGGNRGRNIVDVNLEKTDACNNGLSRTNFTYEINATINRKFYSGCCAVVSQ